MNTPPGPLPREADEPRAEVARVDELHRRRRIARREHVAAVREAPRPVREAVGRIERADDQPGADARAAVAVDLVEHGLARGLQRAVVGLHVFARRILELRDRRRLGHRLAEVAVHGDARHEDVALDRVAQQLDRLPEDPRHVAARVDDAVPASARERVERAVAVADEMLDLRKQLGVRLAAREDRHLVPVGERGVDGVPAEELRPAEDEQLHPRYRSIARETASAPKRTASAGTRSSAAWISLMNSNPCGRRSGR